MKSNFSLNQEPLLIKTSVKSQKYRHSVVIICIPVYNEQLYILETLKSVAKQTEKDFLVVISDNASNDRTSEICSDFVKTDTRFIYCKQPTNLGATENFKYLYEITDSPYLMWLGGHDLIDERYLEIQLRNFTEDPSLVLCYSSTLWIDEKGLGLYQTGGGEFVKSSDSGLARYFQTIQGPWGECTAVNGLWKREGLRGINFLPIAGADHLLLTRAQFFGKFKRELQPIYLRREFTSRESSSMERITGNLDIESEKKQITLMYPLVKAQISDFFLLDMPWYFKLIYLPKLLKSIMCKHSSLVKRALYYLPSKFMKD